MEQILCSNQIFSNSFEISFKDNISLEKAVEILTKVDEHHYRGAGMFGYVPFEVQKYDKDNGKITIGCKNDGTLYLTTLLAKYVQEQILLESPKKNKK